MIRPDIPEPAREILSVLTRNGYRALLVGGAVRDMLLGRQAADVDILTNAPVARVGTLFPGGRACTVGKTFPVCLVNGVEVASSRAKDHDFPTSDLGLRDLTINSMAYDPLTGQIMDPFNGRVDLDNGVVRFTGTPDDRITEDPVRMIRACRFAAKLNAQLHPSACQAIERHADKGLDQTAGERVRLELLKAMGMKIPSLFFRLLYRTGLLIGVLPCLSRCHGLDGGPFHGETVFEHCLLVGDALPARQPLLRLAGYLHDAGKFDAKGIKEGRITYHGHETCTQALAADLAQLRFSEADTAYILSLVHCHMRPLAEKTEPKSVRRLLSVLAREKVAFADFMRLRIADKKSNLAKSPYTLADIRLRVQKVKDELTKGPPLSQGDLAISGHEIMALSGLSPGPAVGRIKQALLERVLDTPCLNTHTDLRRLVQEEMPGRNITTGHNIKKGAADTDEPLVNSGSDAGT